MSYIIWKSGCASVQLNRPKAMNSLSLKNIVFLYERLIQWMSCDNVRHVVIHPLFDQEPSSRPNRPAFCCGGDLKEFISTDRREFTYREYRLDCLIQKYPKPITTLIDGIAMGGGAGLACLAAFRVVTPNTLFSMPEVGIYLYTGTSGCSARRNRRTLAGIRIAALRSFCLPHEWMNRMEWLHRI